ncbi:pyridoxal kinase PdxY [Rhizobium sp. KVB221]|uniref:pyridoxal kinase n=1 Tax=Rhizobium setariae TaxID=2801340 RepID=A0A936YVJ0_9HYPH|nr:pyridoxal kinase PdxY [Rhizobium setariae]MBL0374127.1 pyridoxal kinase PdxY [Rhizobium setariae]
MDRASPAEIIAISSHVVRGSVGNRAIVFSLETLGHPVWSMPTVILPWHPGHGPSTRIVIPEAQFSSAIDDIIRSPWAAGVKAVITGYFGDAGQVDAAARLVSALKAANPSMICLCDPVIGDLKGLYVPEPVATAIRDRLLPLADIATPNRYELAWLVGAALETNTEIMDAALSLGPRRVLVTSSVPMMTGGIGNLLLTDRYAMLAEHRMVGNPPNGLGDLTSALFLSRILKGETDERALQMTTASVFEILARSVKRGADELMLSEDYSSFSTPMAMVQLRQLVHPSRARKK